MRSISNVHRMITIKTGDGNVCISLLVSEDPKFEDTWTTIPILSMEEDVSVKINLVSSVTNSFFKYFRSEDWKRGSGAKQLTQPVYFTMNLRGLSLIFSQYLREEGQTL